MTTTPPPADATAPVTPPAAKAAKRSPKTPKKAVKAENSSASVSIPETPVTTRAEGSSSFPASPSTPSPRKKGERMDDNVKKTIIALKMRSMSTKEIALALNQNYKTVWAVIDKAAKQAAKLGDVDRGELVQLTEAEKKDAALTLKLQGWKTKDIADKLDMKYKSLWAFLDQHQKAAGLPAVTQDPAL